MVGLAARPGFPSVVAVVSLLALAFGTRGAAAGLVLEGGATREQGGCGAVIG